MDAGLVEDRARCRSETVNFDEWDEGAQALRKKFHYIHIAQINTTQTIYMSLPTDATPGLCSRESLCPPSPLDPLSDILLSGPAQSRDPLNTFFILFLIHPLNRLIHILVHPFIVLLFGWCRRCSLNNLLIPLVLVGLLVCSLPLSEGRLLDPECSPRVRFRIALSLLS